MRLYKYYSVSKLVVESLKNFEFYFARFNQLNDPCELTLSKCDREKLQSIRFSFVNPKEPSGIFCLSESNKNVHMWAQYAEGHQGIVVEFETDEDQSFFKELGKVNYVTHPPPFNENMKVSELIYHKSLDSDKEQEWRVFGKNGLRKINPAAVKSIIYGYRFPRGCSVISNCPDWMTKVYPEEKIQAIISLDDLFWGNKLPKEVDYYHTIVIPGEYKLSISEKFVKPKN